MFSIEVYDKAITAKTLEHSTNIFHEALADGEHYYHVHHGEENYDIRYKGNTE